MLFCELGPHAVNQFATQVVDSLKCFSNRTAASLYFTPDQQVIVRLPSDWGKMVIMNVELGLFKGLEDLSDFCV